MDTNRQSALYEITSLSKDFCDLCQSAEEYDKRQFTDRCLNILPRLYWHFLDLEVIGVSLLDSDMMPSYVDDEIYEIIRGRISRVMGADDTYLDTFEEDMRYSETPISATISEGMADIFQPLFNFINIVKDSEGAQLEDAYINCKEEFENYWSQTLCNLLKVFNNIKFNGDYNEDDL